jgi:nitrogen fixation protein NifQ
MLIPPLPARYLGRVSEIFHVSLPSRVSDDASMPRHADFLAHARFPEDALSKAFAHMLSHALKAGKKPLIRGLPEIAFQGLMQNFFPGLHLQNCPANQNQRVSEDVNGDEFDDEYDELVALLMQYRRHQTLASEWLCHAISSACLHDNHLWQDMGLPNRSILTQLMQANFPALAAKNTADMKWKKFFYRQLCEQAQVDVCKSPNCADCCDYSLCFETEAA